MNDLVMALGPAFATGFAVQRILELLNLTLDAIPQTPSLSKASKALLMGVVSLLVGFVLANWAELRVLANLVDNPTLESKSPFDAADVVVTGLVVSAGTEGLNSILKFLGYAKEKKEEDTETQQVEKETVALRLQTLRQMDVQQRTTHFAR